MTRTQASTTRLSPSPWQPRWEINSCCCPFSSGLCWHNSSGMYAIIWLPNDRELMIIGQEGHWTLDYASNNGTFLHELVILLEAHDIDFGAIDHRIMCFAHVINRCCQHVIASLTNVALAESAELSVGVLPPSLPDQQTFEDAVKQDPVALGRNIVHVLRSSV